MRIYTFYYEGTSTGAILKIQTKSYLEAMEDLVKYTKHPSDWICDNPKGTHA
jgi:hypothetical protein